MAKWRFSSSFLFFPKERVVLVAKNIGRLVGWIKLLPIIIMSLVSVSHSFIIPVGFYLSLRAQMKASLALVVLSFVEVQFGRYQTGVTHTTCKQRNNQYIQVGENSLAKKRGRKCLGFRSRTGRGLDDSVGKDAERRRGAADGAIAAGLPAGTHKSSAKGPFWPGPASGAWTGPAFGARFFATMTMRSTSRRESQPWNLCIFRAWAKLARASH